MRSHSLPPCIVLLSKHDCIRRDPSCPTDIAVLASSDQNDRCGRTLVALCGEVYARDVPLWPVGILYLHHDTKRTICALKYHRLEFMEILETKKSTPQLICSASKQSCDT